jgi:hypothetical protein
VFIFRKTYTCSIKHILPATRLLIWMHERNTIKLHVSTFRAGPGWSCSKIAYKSVWHIPMPCVQWINSWWWAEELSETCRVSCRSKFGKLVHLIGFIIKKFVTMHGHMNVKFVLLHFFTDITRLLLWQTYHLMTAVVTSHVRIAYR